MSKKWLPIGKRTKGKDKEITILEKHSAGYKEMETIELIHQESKASHHSTSKMCPLLDIPRATYCRKISIKRIQKSMKRQGFHSVTIKKFKSGKSSKQSLKYYQNLFKQDFSTTDLKQKWMADVTYINTLEDGCCYLSMIINLYSREIISDHFDQTMPTEIVEKVLDDNISNRIINSDLTLHTDLGSQYTSTEYEETLKKFAINHSYSRKSCLYDNTEIELFHAILKKRACLSTTNLSKF